MILKVSQSAGESAVEARRRTTTQIRWAIPLKKRLNMLTTTCRVILAVVFAAGAGGRTSCSGSLTCGEQPSHVRRRVGQVSSQRLWKLCPYFTNDRRGEKKKHLKPHFAFVFFSCRDLSLVRPVFEDRCEKPQFFIIVLSQATFCLWSLTESQICGERPACPLKSGFSWKRLYFSYLSPQHAAWLTD